MRRKRWSAVLIALFAVAIVVVGLLWWDFGAKRARDDAQTAEVVARNLEIPWALDLLPDGSVIFTERPGRVRLIDGDGDLLPAPLVEIEEVAHRGEGGLLGIVVHPGFEDNGFVYVYYTFREDGGVQNKVVRYEKQNLSMVGPTVIIEGIPGASIHNGGRIDFGPDGLLYVTTGDASDSELAQDVASLAGKILRLHDDGAIPSDNPFPGSPVYSYGHRNPQGLAWDAQGRLWSTEHGSSATDEINLIVPGANYGWPVVRGDESSEGMRQPVLHSGDLTWAPSGATVVDGSLFFAGLRSQSLWRFDIDSQSTGPDRYLEGRFGRLRAVAAGDGNMLYICTSNRDGRGRPAADDDLIVRVDPTALPTLSG